LTVFKKLASSVDQILFELNVAHGFIVDKLLKGIRQAVDQTAGGVTITRHLSVDVEVLSQLHALIAVSNWVIR